MEITSNSAKTSQQNNCIPIASKIWKKSSVSSISFNDELKGRHWGWRKESLKLMYTEETNVIYIPIWLPMILRTRSHSWHFSMTCSKVWEVRMNEVIFSSCRFCYSWWDRVKFLCCWVSFDGVFVASHSKWTYFFVKWSENHDSLWWEILYCSTMICSP